MTEEGELLVVASGMAFETRIARGAGIMTCCGQGDRLVEELAKVPVSRCAGVLSFGIAAGLDADLRPGSIVVASQVVDESGDATAADPAWQRILCRRLSPAAGGTVLGLRAPVTGVAEKALLRRRTGAVAADMETHLAAGFAARNDLRFAILRVVADPAGASVPTVALKGMREDGSVDAMAVAGALLRAPSALVSLARVAAGTARARRALRRARRLLGPRFGLTDLR